MPLHPWRRSILWFVGGALSTILLLVIAYFGIRMTNTSGRLPERQAKTEAELASRFAADMKQAADENRTDIGHHVRTLYERQQRDPNATLDFLLLSGGGDRGAAIVQRSLYVAVRSAEAIALRHLYALAEATKLRGDGDVEVRWVAVPQTWKPLNDQFFDKTTMRQLSDEGRRLGADPNSWMTNPP